LSALTIPFVNHLGLDIKQQPLSFKPKEHLTNHLNTFHAGAQFTLAETQSGIFLLEQFPELEGKVGAVLRNANVDYKRPAIKTITAFAQVSKESLEKFQEQFEKKNRAMIAIDVLIKDSDEVITCKASFTWYVQGL